VGAIFSTIYTMSRSLGNTQKVLCFFPGEMLKEIDLVCSHQNIKRNAFIRDCITRELNKYELPKKVNSVLDLTQEKELDKLFMSPPECFNDLGIPDCTDRRV
jgi:hypothetical protein